MKLQFRFYGEAYIRLELWCSGSLKLHNVSQHESNMMPSKPSIFQLSIQQKQILSGLQLTIIFIIINLLIDFID